MLSPFLTCQTPENLSTRYHNGLGVSLSLNSRGEIVSSRIMTAENPFSSLDQLLNLPAAPNNRVFDVFYHLLLSESDNPNNYLSLKNRPSDYELLNKSGTYDLPDWVMFSDDYALAKDWSDALRQCGFKGPALRGVLSTLSGILLLGNVNSPSDVAEGAALIGIQPETQSKYSTEQLIASAYTELVKSLVAHLNTFLATKDLHSDPTNSSSSDVESDEVVSVITVVECAHQHKRAVLRNVFDNSFGINKEIQDDGIKLSKTDAKVSRTLAKLSSGNIVTPLKSSITDQMAMILDFRQLLDSSYSYLATAPTPSDTSLLDVEDLLPSNRIWTILNLAWANDAHGMATDKWSGAVVSRQIIEFFVAEWAQKRREIDFTADYLLYDFLARYSSLMPPDMTVFKIADWAHNEKGWPESVFAIGRERIWIIEDLYRELEAGIADSGSPLENSAIFGHMPGAGTGDDAESYPYARGPYASYDAYSTRSSNYAGGYPVNVNAVLPAVSDKIDNGGVSTDYYDTPSPTDQLLPYNKEAQELDDEDMGYGDEDMIKRHRGDIEKDAGSGREAVVEKMSAQRRFWVTFVWILTWWIPSPYLKYIVRLKQGQVRMAWREKFVICFLITLLNGAIIFYMIFLGRFICPDYDKVWNLKQLSTHQGTNDFYVGIHGNVYDITKFYRLQHSDTNIQTNAANMLPFAGLDLSDYFPRPLWLACPELVSDPLISLNYNTSAVLYPNYIHSSGNRTFDPESVLYQWDWYTSIFQPKIKEYYKGRVVYSRGDLKKSAEANSELYQVIIKKQVYDVTNYFLTAAAHPKNDAAVYVPYNFFPDEIVNIFQNSQGQDITEQFYGDSISDTVRQNTLKCLNNVFVAGEVDFRDSAKCQASNDVLLSMAAILTSVTVIKFLASIRFGGKKLPSPQDKFVICQIPVYTESEDDLRLAVDSLTNLKYDNHRKLMFIICDGIITGAGNDRPTYKIVLDLLGLEDKVNPTALVYDSIAEGPNQLNTAKVYSGLYENDGNVVPFIVVVKCGNKYEKSKPGNRGKRDSQILLLNFLNKVHYQKEMSPLELELFHQMTNVIGVDPELYEYLFMVDADTSVHEDSLTRLVAACASDARIAGICGETGLQNEEKSWTTMIQVYEYFISHHLTKAFESLFGSVTCLPGCFSMYRLKTAKKFKPLIISDEVIRDYSIRHVDTLHKKNLFSLGEDRYLTTLMAKYFPKMKYSFIADAYCQTRAPDAIAVLLSQRRRWINSTVHNLVELLRLDNMCGFCCFSMRGIVFIDLVGTLMLPSVVIYLGYLIYIIASHSSPLPLISIILIAAVYGLQALVFIFRRQWQHIGWMLIYVAAYPIHSFLLPIYSFWNMDNFTWGNTRVVIEEKAGKRLIAEEKNSFNPKDIPLETWQSYAQRNNLPGAQRRITFHDRKGRILQDVEYTEFGYDMQDLSSVHKGETFEQQSFGRPMSTFSEFDRPGIKSPANNPADRNSRFSMAMAEYLNEPQEPFDSTKETLLRQTIRTVLRESDLDSMTKRQLLQKVEDLHGMKFSGSQIAAVDQFIDEELDEFED